MLDFSNGAHISKIALLAAGFKRQFQATDAVRTREGLHHPLQTQLLAPRMFLLKSQTLRHLSLSEHRMARPTDKDLALGLQLAGGGAKPGVDRTIPAG